MMIAIGILIGAILGVASVVMLILIPVFSIRGSFRRMYQTFMAHK